MTVTVGIDIGGTNIKIASIAKDGRVVARESIETQPGDGPKAAFRRVAKAVAAVAGGADVDCAGVGCAGLIDPERGRLLSSPNLPAWENTPLARIATRALGVYTTIDNDATCAAWGEYRCGSNRGCRHMIFVTLGTGVGGGVIHDGCVIRGARNFGGEIGHVTVDANGPRCRCGNRGCVEAFAGAYAMIRDTRAGLKDRKSRYLTRWLGEERRRLTPQLIFEAAARGDGVARAVVRGCGEALGVALASLVNVFNPEVVVVGGGISASLDQLKPHIEREVRRRAFDEPAAMVRFERSTLGNDATAIGAAMFARDRAGGRHGRETRRRSP